MRFPYFSFKPLTLLFLGKTAVTVVLISLIAQLNIYYIALLFAVASQKEEKKSGRCIFVSFLFAALLYSANGLFTDLRGVFDGNIMFL